MNIFGWFASLLSGPADPAPPRAAVPSLMYPLPSGPEYDAVNLPSKFPSACAFVRFCREVLPRVGLSGDGVDLFTAHLGRESGFGASVYDYNFGNIRVFARQNSPWFRHHDGLPYHAYMSATEGMRAMVDKIAGAPRYGGAWHKLLAGDKTWYTDLGLAGYYQTHDPVTHAVIDVTTENVGACQRDYERSLAAVRNCR